MDDKLQLATMARDIIGKTPYGSFDFAGREIMVLPTVFRPDSNTPLLAEIVSRLVEEQLAGANKVCRVYEMGAGTGAAVLKVASAYPDTVQAFASDIAPMATLNMKVNAMWWDTKNLQVYDEGSLYETTPPEQQYDVIFWNIPFFRQDPGGVQDVIYRAGFDPDYKFLTQFLHETYTVRLADGGKVLVAVDEDMCDRPVIHAKIQEAGFTWKVHEQREINWGKMPVKFAFLLLTK